MGAYLVHNVLLVYRLQYLCLDDGMEVGVHEFKDQVDVLVVASPDHVQQLNNVLMAGEGLCVYMGNVWMVYVRRRYVLGPKLALFGKQN